MLIRVHHPRRLVLVVIMVLTALLGSVTLGVPAATAAPAQPVNLSPVGVPVSGTPTLSWNWVPGAVRYRVLIAANPDFTNPLADITTTNRNYVPETSLPATVYWKVAAQDSNGASSSYASATFTRTLQASPAPATPADGAAVKMPDAPPLLTWAAVPGALGYDVKVGPDFDNPAGFAITTVKANSLNYRPSQLGEHSWQVRAQVAKSGNDAVYTEWSPVRTFDVQPLDLPTGWSETASPQAFAQVQDAVLDWTPVPGAVTYQIQLHTDMAFPANGLIQQNNITSTRWAQPNTLPNDTYYWRVRGVDAYGLAADWDSVPVFTFQRSWHDQPQLIHPAHLSTVGNPFYFEWAPAGRLASRYAVQLSQDPTFNTGVETCYTVHTTYVPSGNDCMPEPGNVYYWRVIGIDGGGSWDANGSPVTEAVNAQVNQFTLEKWKALPLSPADGASGPAPTLEWAPVSGASTYRVVLTNKNGGPSGSFTTASTRFNITSNLFPELLTAVKDGDKPGTPISFQWDVVPVDASGRQGVGNLAGGRTYTVTEDDAGTASTPEPVSPADGTTWERFPSLHWTALPNWSVNPDTGSIDRLTYRVYVRRQGATVWPSTPEGTTYHSWFTDTDSNNLAPGNYEWMVAAVHDNVVVASTTDIGTFTIGSVTSTHTIGTDGNLTKLPNPLPEVVGEGVALRADATGGGRCTLSIEVNSENCARIPETPILSWAPMGNAGYYMVYLSNTPGLDNLVNGYPVRVDRNMYLPTSELPDKQAGVAYYWYVQPCTADGKCNTKMSAQYGFEQIANPVMVKPPSPSTTNPADPTVPVVADDVTLAWDDYVATNLAGDTSGSDLPDPATLEADKYRVQWATNPGFTSNVRNSGELDQTQFTLPNDTYNEGDIYWRVQARDQSGNWLPYSAAQHMKRRSPTPILVEPADGGTSDGVRLVWQPLAFAASYDLEVYRTWDAATQAGSQMLAQQNIQQSSYSFQNPLPVQSTPYYWRVRRNDATGKDGQWSTMHSFTVLGQAPVLLSPAVGERVEPNEEVFAWRPSDPSLAPAAYRWQRRAVGQTSTSDNVKTYATAWAPTSTLGDGAWEWRVVALDASDNELGASAWQRFTSATKPLVVQAPEIDGGVQVDQVLSVTTQPVFEPSDVTLAWQWFVGNAPVAGAVGKTYAVRPEDVGQSIKVRVIASHVGYADQEVFSAAKTGALGAAPLALDPVPAISAVTPSVGTTLSVSPPTWSITGVTTRYQWVVGSETRGSNSETATSYVVQPGDVGRAIKVVVTGTKDKYSPGQYTTNSITAIEGPAATSPLPTVTGTAQVGATLSAGGVAWKRNGVAVGGNTSWQWRRDGQPISGATGSSYAVQPADAGRMLSVQASLVQAGYQTGVVTSGEVRVAAASGGPGSGSGTGTATGGLNLGGASSPVPVSGKPNIVAVTPRIGTKVSGRPTFAITFSEPVTGVSKSTLRLKLNGRVVKAKVVLANGGRTAKLRTSSKLKHARTYTLQLTSGIRDLTGVSLATTSWKIKVK